MLSTANTGPVTACLPPACASSQASPQNKTDHYHRAWPSEPGEGGEGCTFSCTYAIYIYIHRCALYPSMTVVLTGSQWREVLFAHCSSMRDSHSRLTTVLSWSAEQLSVLLCHRFVFHKSIKKKKITQNRSTSSKDVQLAISEQLYDENSKVESRK